MERQASTIKGLEANEERIKEELRLKTDAWAKANQETFEALGSYRSMKREYDVLAEASDAL